MKSKHVILVLCVLVFFSACVSRVKTRPASLSESTEGIGENGKVTERETIWFWEDDY